MSQDESYPVERYRSLDDVAPHIQNMILFTPEDRETFDGEEFDKIFSRILERVESLPGDELTVIPHYDGYERLNEYAALLSNSLWIVHYSLVLGENLNKKLVWTISARVPNSTAILICSDNQEINEIYWSDDKSIDDIFREDDDLPDDPFSFAEIICSSKSLVDHAYTYFSYVCNPKAGKGAKRHLFTWNNQVCDYVENYG